MNRTIRRIFPCEDPKWDSYITSHPMGSLYHHSLWEKVLEETYGYEPFYLASLEQEEGIQGVLPLFLVKSSFTGNRLVSLPFSNVCGPLGNSPSIVYDLVKAAKTLAVDHQCKYLELRTQGDLNGIEELSFHRTNSFYNSHVNLTKDPKTVWSNFRDRNLRTEIRKALRMGVEVQMYSGGEHLKEFYTLLTKTRRKHGVPPQPFSFFTNLWRIFHSENSIRLLLASYQGKIIVGLILLIFRNTVIAAYIGSEDHYLPLRPHQLIYWKAMEWGCNSGFQSFDFLRTAKENEGLLYFKQRWGSQEKEIPYFSFPRPRGITSLHEKNLPYRVTTALWRRMPTFLIPWCGKVLYRHFG